MAKQTMKRYANPGMPSIGTTITASDLLVVADEDAQRITLTGIQGHISACPSAIGTLMFAIMVLPEGSLPVADLSADQGHRDASYILWVGAVTAQSDSNEATTFAVNIKSKRKLRGSDKVALVRQANVADWGDAHATLAIFWKEA